MSDRFQLEAQARDVFGKKVRQLRAQGTIPAVIYGSDQEPVHIQVDWTDLRLAFSEAGGSSLVEINVDGETYTTLIRQVDRHPIRRDVLHVDFHAVDLTQNIVSTVAVLMTGNEEVAMNIGGRVILEHTTLDVESLPTHIPSEIAIDVSHLNEIGQTITVADLPEIEGVRYLADPDMVLIRTDYLAAAPVEDVEEEVEEEEMPSEPELVGKDDEEEVEE